MRNVLSLALICSALSACSTTVKKAEEPPQPQARPAEVVNPPAVQAAPVVQEESEATKLARLMQELSRRSVYFDYDNFAVKPEFQNVIQQQAEFLKKAPNDTVTLEGNADERGSSEYNLALGQKRAEAVRKVLVMLGVADSRIEAISYGKEKPRATCHEERCWQEDRRADFVHRLK